MEINGAMLVLTAIRQVGEGGDRNFPKGDEIHRLSPLLLFFSSGVNFPPGTIFHNISFLSSFSALIILYNRGGTY